MALTKSFNQAVLERARSDREYRIGLLEEAVGLYKSGEDAVGLKMVEQFLAAEGQAPAAGPWCYDLESAPDGELLYMKRADDGEMYADMLYHHKQYFHDQAIAWAEINIPEGI